MILFPHPNPLPQEGEIPLPQKSNSASPPAELWLYPTLKTEGQGPALMPWTCRAKR